MIIPRFIVQTIRSEIQEGERKGERYAWRNPSPHTSDPVILGIENTKITSSTLINNPTAYYYLNYYWIRTLFKPASIQGKIVATIKPSWKPIPIHPSRNHKLVYTRASGEDREARCGDLSPRHYRQRELRVTHPRSSLSLSLPFLRSFCSTWHHRPSSISLFQFLRCCCSRLGTLVAFRARNKKKEEKEEGCSARQSELEACFWPRRSRHPFNERELFARWTFSLSSLALRGCYDSFLR